MNQEGRSVVDNAPRTWRAAPAEIAADISALECELCLAKHDRGVTRRGTESLRDTVWPVALSGVVSIALGVFLIAQPGTGALALTGMIGWFAVLAGGIYVVLGFQLKERVVQAKSDWRAPTGWPA
jgi:hypothetical protein